MIHIKFHHFLIAAALFFLFSPFQLGFSQSVLIEKVEPTSNAFIVPYQKWKLPNGLIVIIHEDHSDPIVHVEVAYHVGSARESVGKSGFAHFFEHMMFEGSDHVKDKEHFKIISEAGGTMNGYTVQDKTVYWETVPSNYLETALWLEADRMGFLLDSVTQQKFEIQRSTVKNEKGERVENRPYGLVNEIIGQTLYPQGHPYNWPVIGYVDDLDRVTVNDLKNFFLRWYGPNNAILTIAGDIDSKTVLALTEKYFGTINPSPEVKKFRIPLPVLPADKYASYKDNVYLPLIAIVYPTVPAYHRDEAALVILAGTLGDGNNSIFYKNFVKTEKAIQAGAGYSTAELTGSLSISVLPYPDYTTEIGKTFNETEKLIRETLDEFEKTGITEEAIQREKAKIESALIDQMSTVAGKAGMLSDWQMLLGRSYNLSDELERYNKVTKEDLERVFNKYIKGKYAAIVNVYPKDPMSKKDSVKSVNPNAGVKIADDLEYAGLKYVKAKDTFDRSIKPTPTAPKAPVVPQFYTHQLKNGVKIIGTQTFDIPKVALLIKMEGGNLIFANELKKVGLAEMTAEMMNEGSQNYTTEQLSAALDKLGSTISFSGGEESSNIYVECLTKNLDATLKLLEEKLFKPRFDDGDFKRLKKQTVESIESEKKDANTTAEKLFNNLIYGNTVQGIITDKNFKKFSLDDVKSYYQQYYSPSVASVVVAGDITENDIMNKLSFLEKWQSKEVKIPVISGFPAMQPTQIYLAHKDDAAQSVIVIGHLGLPYDATGEFFKSNIMNFPLGAAFNSRLNLDLRETKGYTYGIRSYFSGSKYPGTFTISSSVKRTVTDASITDIMKEVTDFRNNGLTDNEITFTKNSLLNEDALKYETLNQKASFLSKIMRYNLPKDFTEQQAKVLSSIVKSELNELSKKYIHPDKMVIVVVGNKFLIKDKLEKLGYGKVKEMEVE